MVHKPQRAIKRLFPNWPVVAMHSLVAVLKPSCLRLVIATDAEPEVRAELAEQSSGCWVSHCD